MNQRDAVFAAVVSVVGELNGQAVVLSDSQKREVYERLEYGFTTGQVELRGNRDQDYIKKYIPGLVNNWLRKDTRLNGGQEYVTRKPGSRSGSGDESLIAMKALLKVTTDPSQRKLIMTEIESRLGQLKPKVTINVDALPEHLRHLVRS